MRVQQLRYVLAVAETRNFTRAAEQYLVVQSALSHQVRTLKRELGVALFARTSRRVELTAAAEAFLPGARASPEVLERTAAQAVATVPVTDGPVRAEYLACSGLNPSPVTTAVLKALDGP